MLHFGLGAGQLGLVLLLSSARFVRQVFFLFLCHVELGLKAGHLCHEIRLFCGQFQLVFSHCRAHIFKFLLHRILHYDLVMALLGLYLVQLLAQHLHNFLLLVDLSLMILTLLIQSLHDVLIGLRLAC